MTITSEQALFASLSSASTIVTPNRRLAATLNKRYQQYQLQHKQEYWLTPDILPFSTWCDRTWVDYTSNHFSDLPLLLSPIHEPFIWESIILTAKENSQLLQIAETADIARSAWGLLQQWQIDCNDPIFTASEDSLALLKWLTEFIKICQEKNWLDQASLVNRLADLIKEGAIALPAQFILLGFTEINPQLQRLLTSCESANVKVSIISFSKNTTKPFRLSFSDYEAEIIAIARWAKSVLQKSPTASIGCVIPNLEKVRDRVAQLFTDVFQTNNDAQAYNISAGKPLSEYPIIHSALQLLNLNRPYIYTDYFSHLLTTPFIGDAESERIERAKLDVLLRKYNVNRLALRERLKTDSGVYHLPQYIPKLAKRLNDYYSLLDSLASHLPYSDWAQIFTQLLTLLGWPGERSINSAEYQTVEQWLEVLSRLQSLEQISGPVTLNQAISSINKLARRHVFQAKTPEAPIQVLGLLEAAGLSFDYLWVAGLDDVSWPPQPKPNPLIPKRLQRELQMPHATAERELKFSKSLTEQFKHSASQVYFSHALQDGELELQASPLIYGSPKIESAELIADPYLSPAQQIFSARHTETLIDQQGPKQLSKAVRGGVNVIKQQALCPFKAFAEWRLYAREIEKPLPGLRSKDRGIILHKAMEILWQKLHDQPTLLKLTQAELTDCINSSVREAIAQFPLPLTNANTYLHLEKMRLQKLITDWLAIEMQRPPFTVIAQEQQMQINIKQLQLTIKIDRIDQLADGKKLIIDYKTGINNDVHSWLSDRPDEPQLPLYLLHDPESIAGIGFAQLAPGEHKFIGLSQYDLAIKGIKELADIKKLATTTWDEQLANWKMILANLSDAFYDGMAEIDPKDAQQTCMWCQLKSLCRLYEEVES